jgi:hypothetical protein
MKDMAVASRGVSLGADLSLQNEVHLFCFTYRLRSNSPRVRLWWHGDHRVTHYAKSEIRHSSFIVSLKPEELYIEVKF